MGEVIAGSGPDVTLAHETEVNHGQSQEEPGDDKGQSSAKAASRKGGEPSGEGLPEDTPDYWKSQYKELQREFGKRSEEVKEFKSMIQQLEQFGGANTMLQWARYLSNNQDFAEFIKTQQSKNVLGINMDELDEDGKKAIGLVTKIAESIVDRKIQTELKTRVDPMSETLAAQNIETHFAEMDDQYPDWREMQDDMADLAEELSEVKQVNPTFKDIKLLYMTALDNAGKLETLGEKMYQDKLKSKQKKSEDRPQSGTAKGSTGKTMSLAEAFAAAKEQISG